MSQTPIYGRTGRAEQHHFNRKSCSNHILITKYHVRREILHSVSKINRL